MKTRSLRRLPPSEQFNSIVFGHFKGTPWDHRATGEETGELPPTPQMITLPEPATATDTTPDEPFQGATL